MWVSEIVDASIGHSLDQYGIEPREPDGLPGVVAAPLLHLGFDHLISNTIPLALMGFGIALAGAARVISVTIVVGLLGGLGTWLTAPADSVTIGASGIVFGYAAYLASRGAFTRHVTDIGLGLVVLAIYGGALAGGLAPQDGISWQGHLFGAIGGIVAARYVAPVRGHGAKGRLGTSARVSR